MRMTGVIKGTEQDAVAAANKHDLNVTVLTVLADSVTVEFHGLTTYKRMEISRWFSQGPILPPYPPGTLVVYSNHGGEPLPSEEKGKTWIKAPLPAGVEDTPQARQRLQDALIAFTVKEKVWDLCTQWEAKKNIEFTSLEDKKLFVGSCLR